MSTFPGSPRPLKGDIVLINPNTFLVQHILVLQHNPDTLTGRLQIESIGAESNNYKQGCNA